MVHNNDDQSLQLIEGIKQNNEETYRKIYKMYHGKIKSMVRQFRIRHLEPDDIFQEGLTRAILNIQSGSFKGESSFFSYFYSICRNICLKECARNANLMPIDEHYDMIDLDDHRFDLLNRLLLVRKQLDPPCRQIIDLRFCQTDQEGFVDKCLSFDKIAEIMQIRADNARKRFERCMERLRNLAFADSEIFDLIG